MHIPKILSKFPSLVICQNLGTPLLLLKWTGSLSSFSWDLITSSRTKKKVKSSKNTDLAWPERAHDGQQSSIRPPSYTSLSYWTCCRNLVLPVSATLQGLILVSVSWTFKHWESFSLHLQTQDSRFNVLSVVSLISLSSAELWSLRGQVLLSDKSPGSRGSSEPLRAKFSSHYTSFVNECEWNSQHTNKSGNVKSSYFALGWSDAASVRLPADPFLSGLFQ